jgi:hypothetical protein
VHNNVVHAVQCKHGLLGHRAQCDHFNSYTLHCCSLTHSAKGQLLMKAFGIDPMDYVEML